MLYEVITGSKIMWRKTLCVAAAILFSIPLTAGAADGAREVADALKRMGADAALKAKATERGGSTATFCANCHGSRNNFV